MAGGGVMLSQAVETSLAVRRAADFKLRGYPEIGIGKKVNLLDS
jgi:hypothetical protein